MGNVFVLIYPVFHCQVCNLDLQMPQWLLVSNVTLNEYKAPTSLCCYALSLYNILLDMRLPVNLPYLWYFVLLSCPLLSFLTETDRQERKLQRPSGDDGFPRVDSGRGHLRRQHPAALGSAVDCCLVVQLSCWWCWVDISAVFLCWSDLCKELKVALHSNLSYKLHWDLLASC